MGHDTLPQPCLQFAETAHWRLYQLEPIERADYARQSDLLVGQSIHPAMWENAHTNGRFDSSSYSRFGEIFCYVKVDGIDGLEGSKFLDKSAIEDAIDDALALPKIGCVIGGGAGIRYSYIDLAVVDVDRAEELIVAVLREGKIPRRTWLLFYDTSLEHNWIGIWDDTGPPP